MSLREWLIIIGALVILGVIVDGLRRMHRARQESLEIARGMGSGDIGQTPIDDGYNSELPNGGARPVGGDKPSASARPGGSRQCLMTLRSLLRRRLQRLLPGSRSVATRPIRSR